MANAPTPGPTSAGTREPATSATETLTPGDVTDERDNAPRIPAPELSGKRVRAIPYKGGTQIHLRRQDFANYGVDHPDVTWDFRKIKGNMSVPVDDSEKPVKNTLTSEAAEMLVDKFPTQFEYMNDGSE